MKEAPSELLGKHLFNFERDYLPNSKARMGEGLSQAERHKEKLLEFDKTRFAIFILTLHSWKGYVEVIIVWVDLSGMKS